MPSGLTSDGFVSTVPIVPAISTIGNDSTVFDPKPAPVTVIVCSELAESMAGFDGVPEALDRVVPRSDLERDLLLHAKRSARSQKDPGQVADDALKGALNGIG